MAENTQIDGFKYCLKRTPRKKSSTRFKWKGTDLSTRCWPEHRWKTTATNTSANAHLRTAFGGIDLSAHSQNYRKRSRCYVAGKLSVVDGLNNRSRLVPALVLRENKAGIFRSSLTSATAGKRRLPAILNPNQFMRISKSDPWLCAWVLHSATA